LNVYILLDFPKTYINAKVFCQTECQCLHNTVNMEVCCFKTIKNTYPKGRALVPMYRVVSQTKSEYTLETMYS